MITEHVDSVVETLEAAGVTVHDSLAPDDAGDTDRGYAVVFVGRRYAEGYRLSGRSQLRALRVPIMTVGHSAWQARWVEDKVSQALDGKRVSVDGVVCTPARFESARAVEVDPDTPEIWSGTSVWTYVATPV